MPLSMPLRLIERLMSAVVIMYETRPRTTQAKFKIKMATLLKRQIALLAKLTNSLHENGLMTFQMNQVMGRQAGQFYPSHILLPPFLIPRPNSNLSLY
jgi:hypothetical protein